MAYKREHTFEEGESLPSIVKKLNREMENLERALVNTGVATKVTVTKSKGSGGVTSQPPPQSVGGGYPSVRSLNGNTYVLSVPEIVIDTDSALTLTTLANGAVLISATGGGAQGGPFLDYITHGVGLADIVGETIALGVTMPDTDYVVVIRGYKSDGTPVGGIKVTKTVTDFTVYPPEDVTYFDYSAYRFGDYGGIIVNANTAGEDFALSPALPSTDYIVHLRAYLTADGTPVDGVKVTKATDKITFLPPESGVTIEFVVRTF